MNCDEIKQQVIGRWHGVFNSLGIEVGDGRHCPCPICGGEDRFRFDDIEGKGSWICNQCGAGDGWQLLQKKLGVDFKSAIEAVKSVIGGIEKVNRPNEPKYLTAEKMKEIYLGSMAIREDDPVYRYITETRGLRVFPDILRYHPACWEPETKRNQKAMLTVFHCAKGQAVTMHRTFLDADGKKLAIKNPKKILPPVMGTNGVGRMAGGAARLYPLKGEILGIAEGVETAIAASLDMGIPVWSALTSTLLESFIPPHGVRELVVIGDNDANYTGQKSAYILANKVEVLHKIRAKVFIPDRQGEDWLDVYSRNKRK